MYDVNFFSYCVVLFEMFFPKFLSSLGEETPLGCNSGW
jgi:hypothetical protein